MSSNVAYNPGDTPGGTPYRVVRVLGAGGMGTVYEVEDTTVGKHYVLKTLHPTLARREEMAAMMRHEGRSLAKVQHPHIVDVITAGTTTDRFALPFIVMEWLDGATLRAIASSATLSHEDIVTIATELLEALYHMHEGDPERGRPPVLHRDIKPENIFLARTAAGAVVKLLDLGIAVLLDGQTHGTHGTPKYMAPEQFRGQTLSAQTDLYQVGCVFFELLTQRHPFAAAKTTTELVAAHLGTEAPRVSAFVDVPRRVDDVIASALAKDPKDRPRDAYAFMVAMRALRDAVGARPPLSNTTVPDLITAINRQTESGYEAYATGEGTVEDLHPAFVVASTVPFGARKMPNGTVPIAPDTRASSPPAARASSPAADVVDRTAATRSQRPAARPRSAPRDGTEELIDGLDPLPASLLALRRSAPSETSVPPAPTRVEAAATTPMTAGFETMPVSLPLRPPLLSLRRFTGVLAMGLVLLFALIIRRQVRAAALPNLPSTPAALPSGSPPPSSSPQPRPTEPQPVTTPPGRRVAESLPGAAPSALPASVPSGHPPVATVPAPTAPARRAPSSPVPASTTRSAPNAAAGAPTAPPAPSKAPSAPVTSPTTDPGMIRSFN